MATVLLKQQTNKEDKEKRERNTKIFICISQLLSFESETYNLAIYISRNGMAVNQESFIEKYIYFVTKNPLLANEIEVGLKWVSYIIAGKHK